GIAIAGIAVASGLLPLILTGIKRTDNETIAHRVGAVETGCPAGSPLQTVSRSAVVVAGKFECALRGEPLARLPVEGRAHLIAIPAGHIEAAHPGQLTHIVAAGIQRLRDNVVVG